MEKSELIYLASVVVGKRMSYDDFKYSDYMYGQESFIDDVWEFVEECDEIGRSAFREKYNEYKLYSI